MNKKFLSAVLFGALMVGSSVTFTGCIDNDEPAGITDLRGAKAELLRARIAVEAANAARENANAALILAQAEVQKANAAYVNAQTAKMQAEADSMAAVSDAERAKADSLIAHYKQKMEEAALTHDSVMVALRKELAIAERQYELALKQIEIAKATLSDSEKVSVSSLETKLGTAQKNVVKATENVSNAEDAVYEIMLLKAQGLAVDSVATGNDIKKSVIAELEKNVERDSIELVGAQYELDRLNQYAEKDPKVADWVAEIKELDDSIKGLNNIIEAHNLEITKFENSQEVLDAQKAKEDALAKFDELNTFATSPYDKIEIPAYSYTYKFEAGQNGAGGTGNLGHGTYGRDKFELSVNNASVLSTVKDELDWAKVELAKYTAERINRLEKIATDGISADKKAYEDAVKAWKTAKEKYESASAYKDADAIKTLWDAVKDKVTDANGADADKKAAARLAIAKALTTYYTNAKVVDLTTKEITLSISISGTPTDVKKSAAEWLADATYGGAYLTGVLKAVNGNNESIPNEVAFKQLFTEVGNVVKEKKTVQQFLTAVQNASNVAFGIEMLVNFGGENNYMMVEPTEADVLAWINDGKVQANALGKAGLYYDAKQMESTQEYMNYKEWIADLKVAIPSLEAEVKLIEDAIEAAKAAAKTAKIASDKAAADLKAMKEAGTKELTTAKKLAETKLGATKKVRAALLQALGTYSEVTGSFSNLDDFTTALKADITVAEDALYDAIEALANSKVDLQKVLDGRYDAEAMAREQLAKEMAALEAAQKAYETALKNLEVALKIMAGESTAE